MPFALIRVDNPRHLLLQFVGNPQTVIHDHIAQILDAALQIVHPGAGALQTVGGTNVKHQETVHGAQQGFVVQIAGKQIRMAWFHAAVPAQIKVPALVGRNHPDVFTLRFGAFTGAA
ncbi:hypothetical protein D3C80_911030 [compost metagenome]